jgi:predicted ATPase
MDAAPDRFEQLRIDGFRRLYDVSLDLRNLCVLIGANGVGKTSLLDIFALLAASADGHLSDKVSELGGLPSILTLQKASSCHWAFP